MTTRRSLRSRRICAYNEGDLVEIVSPAGQVFEARLLSMVKKGRSRSSNTSWLVTFTGATEREDEVVDETAICRRVPKPPASFTHRILVEKDEAISSPPTSSSETNLDLDQTAVAEKESSTEADQHNHLSERERRMMKRQEKFWGSNSREGKKAADSSKKGRASPKKTSRQRKHPKAGKSEEVIKVKLKTGTLCIYRGSNPRVEFLRRY